MPIIPNFYKEHCVYLPYLLGWFVTSTALSSYNKILFGVDYLHFPCPLLMTSFHFMLQWIASTLVMKYRFRCWKRKPANSYQSTNINEENEENQLDQHQHQQQQQLQYTSSVFDSLSWREYIAIGFPVGFITAIDVGLSNLSLAYLSLTLYTMIKAASPIVVLFFVLIMKLEKPRWSLFAVVALITAGEFLVVHHKHAPHHEPLTTYQHNSTMGNYTSIDEFYDTDEAIQNTEDSHNVVIGIILCICATIATGMRWTLVQFKIQNHDPPLKSPIEVVRIIAPFMFAILLMIALMIEDPFTNLNPSTTPYFQTWEHGLKVVGAAVFGGLLAVSLVFVEFGLIVISSAMVLMMGGVAKELLTISVGVIFFHDQLTFINICGIVVVFSGVILYKLTYKSKAKLHSTKLLEDSDEVIPGDDSGEISMHERIGLRRGNSAIVDITQSPKWDGKRIINEGKPID